MNDTTRRFLSAITERVPEGGRIVELRLFPAIRQGGIESGVAVVAVEPPAVAPDVEAIVEGDAVDGATSELSSALSGDAEHPDDAQQGQSSLAENADASGVERADGQGDEEIGDEAHANGERVVSHVLEGIADDRSTAAALSLVDTDIAPEEEEGTAGDADTESATYIPSAGVSDEDDVADALDEELTKIVVTAEREIRRAGSRDEIAATLQPALVGDQQSEADVLDEEATVEAARDGEDVLSSSDDRDRVGEDSPYADAPPPPEAPRRELLADLADVADMAGESDGDADAMRLDDILALPSPDNTDDPADDGEAEDVVAAPRVIQRYAILTASYRLTIKGPDRGKWDVDLTHEADAPLATVERVARGVAKRSGDGSEPEHFSGESLKQALDAPAWIETT